MPINLNPGDFANPNSVVGAYSASAAATQTTTNSEAVPNRFSNNLVYVGSNTYGGTASNVESAKSKFVRLSGGRKLFARNNKMNGGTKLGMNLENTSTSVGTVGAGHPGHTAVDDSANRPNQPVNKVSLSDIKGGKRSTKRKRSCKVKKTNRHKKKTCGRKSHNHRTNRVTRKKLGGSLLDGCGCTGGGSKHRRSKKGAGSCSSHSKNKKMKGAGSCSSHSKDKKMKGAGSCSSHSKDKKMKGAGSCSSHSKDKKMKGGKSQPFSNEPLSFGYSIDDQNVNASTSALANPMPFKSYFACEDVARN